MKWIKTTDKMPEDLKSVLFYYVNEDYKDNQHYEFIAVGHFDELNDSWVHDGVGFLSRCDDPFHEDDLCFDKSLVTHWATLPDYPSNK